MCGVAGYVWGMRVCVGCVQGVCGICSVCVEVYAGCIHSFGCLGWYVGLYGVTVLSWYVGAGCL